MHRTATSHTHVAVTRRSASSTYCEVTAIVDDQLLAAHEPYVRQYSRSLRRKDPRLTYEDAEEAMQASRLALSRVPAEHRNNPAYCRTAIRNAARSARSSMIIHAYRTVSADAGWDLGYAPLASAIAVDPMPETDAGMTAGTLWARLSPRQQQIMSLHLGLHSPRCGHSVIARIMGVSKRQVVHEIKVAMALLRQK